MISRGSGGKGVGLHAHLKDLIEFVEEIDKRRAKVGLQGGKDVHQRHLEGLRLGPVDIEEELGAVGAEGGEEAAQARLRVCRLDSSLVVFWSSPRPRASAVFDHHLEAARLPQPPDWRRDETAMPVPPGRPVSARLMLETILS